MALELVTGYWGMEHITAEQDADLNAGIIGSGNYVLNIGEKMRAEAVSANQVRIFDGVFMAYGRQCILGDGEYEDVTIENGTPGLVRNDMIVVKYKKDEESGKENATFAVLKGETGSVVKDPVPNRQDIRSGAFESEVPMYRVKINGLAIEKIEPLFSIPMTNDDLSNKLDKLNDKATDLSNYDLFIPGDTTKAPPNNDFLTISLQDRFNALNKCHYFRQPSGTEFKMCPPVLKGKEFIGYREVYWYAATNIMIQLKEFHPIPGRVWSNFYNSGTWTGWKSISPS